MGKLILFGSLLILGVAGNAQTLSSKIEDISWLAGCWERIDPSKDLQISEQWMKPAGGIMLGTGRTVKNGKTVDFEFTRIEQRTEGLFYVARPAANKEDTDFKLIRSGKSEIVFENLAHDFPQRVMYRREDDNLFARIEGNRNGKAVGVDFPMKRQSCEG
jgi:hypothetical protein